MTGETRQAGLDEIGDLLDEVSEIQDRIVQRLREIFENQVDAQRALMLQELCQRFSFDQVFATAEGMGELSTLMPVFSTIKETDKETEERFRKQQEIDSLLGLDFDPNEPAPPRSMLSIATHILALMDNSGNSPEQLESLLPYLYELLLAADNGNPLPTLEEFQAFLATPHHPAASEESGSNEDDEGGAEYRQFRGEHRTIAEELRPQHPG